MKLVEINGNGNVINIVVGNDMNYLKEYVFMFDTMRECLEQLTSKQHQDNIKTCMKIIELKLSSEVNTRFPLVKSDGN
ncbi:MAG: hypothetical protein JNM67_08905 [Bacteroidetes bacterium]|nr:hypothetical protein [Bacteroidota bacterium]